MEIDIPEVISNSPSTKMGNFISKLIPQSSEIELEAAHESDEEKKQASISDAENSIGDHDQAIETRDRAVKDQNEAVESRDRARIELSETILGLDKAKTELAQARMDRDEARRERAEARLERDEAVKHRDHMIHNQNIHIQRQADEIKKLIDSIDGTKAIVLSQTEEIQSTKLLLQVEKTRSRKEIQKLQKQHREEKKVYMPCFQVGHMTREHSLYKKGYLPQDEEEATWRGARICNCTTHQGRPLADATVLLFDEMLRPRQLSEVYHQEFEESYCVPAQFAFDNSGFKKFQALLRMYEDMSQFGVEATTTSPVADKCVLELREFIAKVHPQGLYKNDADILRDPEASADFARLSAEHALAVAKHQTFILEKYRISKRIKLPFNLLDIIENDPRAISAE